MAQKKRYGVTYVYKRRSQVYKRLRTRKVASGQYIVEHEPSKTSFYVFKRIEHEDWVIAGQNDRHVLRGGFRKKDDAMELLEKYGPRAVRIA